MIAKPLTVIHGACGHDCPDTCSWKVEVHEGKAERMYGDPDHPFTRGTLCGKVNHYLERVYHSDRVLYPLKRIGAKGEGRFIRVSWDEALKDIVARHWRDTPGFRRATVVDHRQDLAFPEFQLCSY